MKVATPSEELIVTKGDYQVEPKSVVFPHDFATHEKSLSSPHNSIIFGNVSRSSLTG